jgi:hypothetical protein
METRDLIAALSADAGRRRAPLDRQLTCMLVLAVLAAVLVFLATIGPRADIGAAVQTVRFNYKFVVTLGLLGSTLWLFERGLRPGALRARDLLMLMIAPGLLGAAVVVELLVLPSGLWGQTMIGSNALVCLTYIPIIGLLPLGMTVLALHTGAPTRPGLIGALGGLASGGLAATLYAMHCPDDSALFVMLWYPLAIGILTAAGSVLGRLVGRW